MSYPNNMERKLRRILSKAGYSLHKSRTAISPDNLGGYMIVDASTNGVVCGSRYELTLDDVADWLSE